MPRKYQHHLDRLSSLEIGESYIMECKKTELLGMMSLHQRKSLKQAGKLFSSTSYTAIPTSMTIDHIYILKFTRRC